MAKRKYPVVDTDAHYYENPRKFAQYLDEVWKQRIENWSGPHMMPIAGNSQTNDPRLGGRTQRAESGYPSTASTEGCLEVMEYLESDIVCLLPGSMLTVAQISDARKAVAFANGYIDHVLNDVVNPAKGLYALIVAPNQAPKDAAKLIDRVGNHDGVCGVAMMTDGPVLPFGDPYYDPVYEACCRNKLPLVFHSGYGGPEGRESGYGLQTFIENHMAFVLNNQIQLTSIVMQGVPERFPDLKIIWQEAGVFWIPQIMFRLDSEYSMARSRVSWLKKPPSEYIKNMYFGSQPLERVPKPEFLKYVFEMIDAPNTLMFATDWPHFDFDSPVVIERLGFLNQEEKAQILGGNALKAFRFRAHQ